MSSTTQSNHSFASREPAFTPSLLSLVRICIRVSAMQCLAPRNERISEAQCQALWAVRAAYPAVNPSQLERVIREHSAKALHRALRPLTLDTVGHSQSTRATVHRGSTIPGAIAAALTAACTEATHHV